MSARIAILMGRPPGADSVLPEAVARMSAAGASVRCVLARDGDPLPDELLSCDLVALRGLGRPALRAAEALERAGVRCCNGVAATLAARDKRIATEALAAAGVPAPRAEIVPDWDTALLHARERPVVVKALDGSRGRGVFLGPSLPRSAPASGPFLVQERIDGDGRDRKLYAIGGQVAGVLRRWPPRSLADKLGEPFAPEPGMRDLALAAAAALGLEICGVDVVVGPAGAAVVDVNAFPGFKGVEGAAQSLAEHLLRRAEEVAACAS